MSGNTEGFKKTVSVAYVLSIVGQLCEILFYFILFKFLPVEEVGFFSWAMAIALFFAVSLDLGLNQTLIRAFSQSQLDLKSAAISSLVLRLPIIILAILALQGWYVYWGPTSEQYLSILLVGMIQLLMMGERICQSWLRANARQVTANILAALVSVGRLGVALILICWWGVLSATYLFAYLFLIHIVVFPMALLVTYYEHQKVRSANPSPVLKLRITIGKLGAPSFIFALIGLLTIIQNRLDWLMVSGFVSKVELAHYSLANKGYEFLLMFIGVALTTAYPWMCKDNPSQDFRTKLNTYLSLVIFLGVTVSLGAALYMPEILHFLWGAKYESTNPMIQLLLVGAALSVISAVFYHLLISRRLERKILPVAVIGTGIQVVSNLLLIPALGGFGATIGMLVLIFVTAIGLFWVVRQEKIMTIGQLNRPFAFFAMMSLLAGIFWVFNISMFFGVVALFTSGVAGMYFILITNGEKRLLTDLVGNYLTGMRRV